MEKEATAVEIMKLQAIEATPENFSEFGQVIEARPASEGFGPNDAQLYLTQGIPRFYIMRLKGKPLKFTFITHHASVTQCLGAIGGDDWYMGVAKASIVDSSEVNTDSGSKARQSHCGHFYLPPIPDEVRVFKFSGPKFVKLHLGTWHAGPLAEKEGIYYNLELSNTNVVDHTTHDFKKKNGVYFLIAK